LTLTHYYKVKRRFVAVERYFQDISRIYDDAYHNAAVNILRGLQGLICRMFDSVTYDPLALCQKTGSVHELTLKGAFYSRCRVTQVLRVGIYLFR
jgi:hypothetical protein